MVRIQAVADGQQLRLSGGGRSPVRGSRRLVALEVRFAAGSGWDGCVVAADFDGCGAVPLEDGVAMLPDEACDMRFVRVRLVGARPDGYRIVTNRVTVRQEG